MAAGSAELFLLKREVLIGGGNAGIAVAVHERGLVTFGPRPFPHIVRVVGNDGVAVVVVEEAALERRPGGRPAGQPGERPPGQPERVTGDGAHLWQRIAELEVQRDHMAAELLAVTARAARAEGEGVALRDALADLAGRLDVATAELSELRRPWGGGCSDSMS